MLPERASLTWSITIGTRQTSIVTRRSAHRSARRGTGVDASAIGLLATLCVLAGGAATAVFADEPVQGGYSLEPLQAAVFDPAAVAVETARFNNWLNGNSASLSAETMKGPREHLYALIASHAASTWRQKQVVLPREPDLVLQTLFAWSERLGVYGGYLVHEAVRLEQTPALEPLMPVPAEFSLARRGDLLVVSSKRGGWSFAVPYYFMLWNMQEFDAKEGPRTQLVAISTGTAKHEGLAGHSQATLMLLAGPGEEPAAFVAYWRNALGLSGESVAKPLPVEPLRSVTKYDDAAKMHTELTHWATAQGPIAVAYLGMNGTYQRNRPHFFDFLRSLQAKGK